MSNIELLPCPFCGHSTPEFERLGTGKQSCIVACGNCGCRHESGDEWDDCGKSWNTRAIESQAAQIAALKTVMIAAAEEIAAHWEAHCDAEGYGPQNLLRRLEEGIPSEYGYTAGAFAALTAERDALRADAERYRWLRDQHTYDGEGDEPSIMRWYVQAGREPVPCDPGALDDCIDESRASLNPTNDKET